MALNVFLIDNDSICGRSDKVGYFPIPVVVTCLYIFNLFTFVEILGYKSRGLKVDFQVHIGGLDRFYRTKFLEIFSD